MAYAEFPHTHYEEHDHIELILLYKELVEKYDGTLNQITELSERLTRYENDMTARINELENTTIPSAVNRAVATAMAGYKSEVDSRFNKVTNDIIAVEALCDVLDGRIDSVDESLSQDISGLRTELTGATYNLQVQINNFNQRVDTLQGAFDTFKEEVRQSNREFESAVEAKQNDFEKYMVDVQDTYEDRVTNRLAIQRDDYIIRDATVLREGMNYTDHQVSALHTLIESLQPSQIEDKIQWLWDNCCGHCGYTALEWYNEPRVTCKVWNESEITALEWYTQGKHVFHWFDNRTKMFSPVSGKWKDVREVVTELCQALKINGVTAEEYDKMGFTAEEYEMLGESAGEYDWNGREMWQHV